jgi:hypothetical protein
MRVRDRLPGEGSVEEVLAGSAAWCVECCAAEELTARRSPAAPGASRTSLLDVRRLF